jgi:hypothetical protein
MDTNMDPPSSPRPFGEVLRLWLKVFTMDEAFFAGEAQRADSANTVYGVLILTVFAGVVPFLPVLFTGLTQFYRMIPDFPWEEMLGVLFIANIIFTPVGYYLGYALMHLAARLLKGTGSYTTLVYLVSLFYIPLGLIITLAILIPYAGWLIALGLAAYEYILTVRVFKAAYALTGGKAVTATLGPILAIWIIFIPICAFAILIAMAPGLFGLFHNMTQFQGIGTPAP